MKIFSFTSLQHHHRHHHFDVHTKLRDRSSSNVTHQPPCESEVCRHTGNSTTSTPEQIKSHRKKFDWRSSSSSSSSTVSSSSSSWYRSNSSSAKPVFEQHHHDGDNHHHNNNGTNAGEQQQQTERIDSHRCRTVSDVSTLSFNTAVLNNSTASSPTAAAAGVASSPTTTSRHVVFGEVEVREYDVTVGDHPLCMTGCPLSLDWTYSVQIPVPVDDFELCRTPTRRDRNYLRTSWEDRHKLLVEDGTCSEVEIRRMNRKLHRDRCCNQRITEKINIAFFHCPNEIIDQSIVGVGNTKKVEST